MNIALSSLVTISIEIYFIDAHFYSIDQCGKGACQFKICTQEQIAIHREILTFSSKPKGGFIMPSHDERLFAALIFVVSFFTVFIGPLIIWLLKKEDSTYVDYYGREYFNFFISYGVYSLISTLLMLVLIGFLTIWIVGVLYFLFSIVAAIKAYEGTIYKIPFVFRLIR